MTTTTEMMQILAGVGVLGLGFAGIAVVCRDPRGADEHTVADYQPAYRPMLHPSRRDWPLVDRHGAGRRRLRARAMADLILPPVPADATVPLPLYAEAVVAGVVRARYGTTDPAAVARRMLAELGEQARADLAVAR